MKWEVRKANLLTNFDVLPLTFVLTCAGTFRLLLELSFLLIFNSFKNIVVNFFLTSVLSLRLRVGRLAFQLVWGAHHCSLRKTANIYTLPRYSKPDNQSRALHTRCGVAVHRLDCLCCGLYHLCRNLLWIHGESYFRCIEATFFPPSVQDWRICRARGSEICLRWMRSV
jgi:hypothetical protein